MVYGGDEPIEAIRRLAPDVRTISRATKPRQFSSLH
jgi:glycerophosphoryl diester phosphodiesterase